MIRRLGRRYYYKVLGLFLAAALLPMVALSLALAGIGSASLERAILEAGEAAAEGFADRVESLVDRADSALREVAASPEARAFLAGPPSAEAATALSRALAAKAPRGGELALAFVGAEGDRAAASRDLAPDWDPRSHGEWGILRKAREAGGSLALIARRRLASDGETEVLLAGRAMYAAGGGSGSDDAPPRPAGFAVAAIGRSALVRAARPGGGLVAADAEVADASGMIAFSLSDPAREGRFADEAAPAEPASARSFEARPRRLSTRILVADGLAQGFATAVRATALAGMGLCAGVAALLALVASRIATGPVLALSSSMRRLEAGDLSARVAVSSDDEIGSLARSFNAMAERLDSLVRAAVEDGVLLRRAELDALAAQMNPHFLYNTLGSIRSLAKLGRCAEVAETASRLGKLLRASVESRAGHTTVGAALDMVRHYVAIERVRFGQRVALEEDVDPRLMGLPIPSLVLEPLAENAFIHGIEMDAGAGRLLVAGGIEGGDAVLAVEDDGPGCEGEALAELRALLAEGAAPSGGRRVGLANTNRRLRLAYGPRYGVSVGPRRDGGRGFRAEIRVPIGEGGPCTG